MEWLEFRQARRRCEPVVGGDDHERVVGKPGAVEGVEEPADVGIDLGHEVAVERRAGAALECGGRQQGRVWCRQWEVEEERPTVAGLSLLFDVGRRFVHQPRLDLLHLEIVADRPGPPEPRGPAALHVARWHARGAILGEPHVGGHVERRGDSQEAVEAVRQRAPVERPGEVDVLGPRARAVPSDAEMPLPEDGRRVAVLPEQFGDGQPAGLDERRLVSVEHAFFERAPP